MKQLPFLMVAAILAIPAAHAADWPQFMSDSAHTGNVEEEVLQMPLGLIAQIKLDVERRDSQFGGHASGRSEKSMGGSRFQTSSM